MLELHGTRALGGQHAGRARAQLAEARRPGARAALQPEVLLVDNPLAGLDPRHVQWWLNFLDQLSAGHE